MDLWRPVFVGVTFEKQQAKALVKEVGKKGAPRQVIGRRVVRTSEPPTSQPKQKRRRLLDFGSLAATLGD